MKKVFSLLFSNKLTLALLIILAASIGTATFIEEKYDTVTARLLVYNAWWFEGVMVLLALNFIGNIWRFKLYRKGKWSNLLFHLAFILLIIGAGITRYLSYEGMMHIREGESSDVIYTSDPYLLVRGGAPGIEYNSDRKLWFSPVRRPSFHDSFEVPGKGKVSVDLKEYLSNAVTQIDENREGGKDILQLVLAGSNGKETVLFDDGGTKTIGNTTLAFNAPGREGVVRITEKEGSLYLSSPTEIALTLMHSQPADTAAILPVPDTMMEFKTGGLYSTENMLILLVKRFSKATRTMVQGGPGDQGVPMLLMEVTLNGKKQELTVEGRTDMTATFKETEIDGVRVGVAYGNKEIKLPFSIRLDDFILDRYAGSMSPSSYSSEVTLMDPHQNLQEKRRIYMNHVLDHNGYRFFQSSYDPDEKGTILSVNHDFYGTWVSYTGYILLAIGFLVTLFSKTSRFRMLSNGISRIRAERKASAAMMVLLVLGFSGLASAQTAPRRPVSAEHAERFGHLVVQTFDGRFEPMHTLAVDVMHKISRKDHFTTDVKGKMDDIQVFMDMLLDADYWKQQKVVYIREKPVRDALGVEGGYASFWDFIDGQSNYKLGPAAEEAFRKRPAEQNAFDKEVIRVDERLNVWMSVLNGGLLKVFPVEGSANHQWVSFTDSLATIPLTGEMHSMNADLPLQQLNYSNIMRLYLTAVYDATATGDYSKADAYLERISTIQRRGTPPELLPSASRVNLEIWYNNANIFPSLRNWYGLISIALLVLAFIDNLRTKRNRVVTWLLNGFIILLSLAFLYHTYGLGLRWYLTGHAPWSNGYEALLVIGWGSLLAGFSFMRYSKITLAATALLAFSVLMTAGHSSYDPQLTNLQPVLKSYWLIIHVAVITVSYGFLALGFILGLINLVLYAVRRQKSAKRLGLIISELTFTNEMALSIGIVLATVGTFLGGVWANESWGRYWGWDAKEAWALVIVITYATVLHLRLVPKFQPPLLFNIASVLGFSSVLMTFIGVNYYLSKGLHSYAAGERAIFPLWAWGMILAVVGLIVVAWVHEGRRTKEERD
jgi:cytochrome c-type biogenesis protein CcsB